MIPPEIVELVIGLAVGTVGGFILAQSIYQDGKYTKGYDKGNRDAIEFMVKLQAGIFDKENQQRNLRVAMENWP